MKPLAFLRWLMLAACCLLLASSVAIAQSESQQPPAAVPNSSTQDAADLFARDNLVAWCIVPFDAAQRGPVERAEMLQRLGIKRLAYDYRAQHIPTFDQEVEALREHGIELTAWWFPGALNDEARGILDVLRRNNVQTQLWVTGGGEPTQNATEQQQRVKAEADRIRPIAAAAAEIGCSVGLYNHGGWFGQPENQIAIIEELQLDNVGIVYNLHHGHEHLDRLAELLQKMRPYLMAVNLNGMTAKGDAKGQKILPIGAGDLDRNVLQIIRDSGYRGPIGILNHTDLDAEARLKDNLAGLSWVSALIDGRSAAPPEYETWEGPAAELTNETREAPAGDESESAAESPEDASASEGVSPLPDDIETLRQRVDAARLNGNAMRGMAVFASQKFACLSCHKIGPHGGDVGPSLEKIGTERPPWQLVEAVLDPQRHIEPEYRTTRVLTSSGLIRNVYVQQQTDQTWVVRDPSSGQVDRLPVEEIELHEPGGSVMPVGLVDAMRPQQQRDLFAFLIDLGHGREVPEEMMRSVLGHWAASEAADFDYQRGPIDPENWAELDQPVNRDRLFQYYTKQAEHFRKQKFPPPLLAEFPGLDGGQHGHWGNQNEAGWMDARWNDTVLGSVQTGVFRAPGIEVPRGICLQLGEPAEWFACFNPETLSYDAVWQGEFLKFSAVRHGFMDGLTMAGTLVPEATTDPVGAPREYLGMYRHGRRVIFSYRIGKTEYLDAPWVEKGQFVRVKAPRATHPLKHLVDGGPAQWPQQLETEITFGAQRPYAVDNFAIPRDNPWNALIFGAGLDFLPGGDAVVTTMQGDVWRVSGLDAAPDQDRPMVRWRRIAAGLHQALGVVAGEDGLYVLGRDRITRLVDLNDDGEMDFYQSFCDSYETSPGGHDFICGLQRDPDGYFYTASSNQGLIRISPDGRRSEVVATGFRDPDGLGVYPDGTVTIPCSEGNWTPASMICARQPDSGTPYFGFGGPRDDQPPALPMVYLPRGIDNSSGGQAYVDSDDWGPLQGTMVHTSFGAGVSMLLLRDTVAGQIQGAVSPLPGDFRSGVHRARFRPQDGQLYVVGMAGWGSYTTDDGCFQRMRYTGDPVTMPIGFHVHRNGVRIRFSGPLDADVAADPKSHFAQAWNYRYSAAYGSPEYSTMHQGVRGHDVWTITSAQVVGDGRELFLEIPDLQPVNQLHLRIYPRDGEGRDLFMTVHALDHPFTDFDGYEPLGKEIDPHPILADLSRALDTVPNPWRGTIDGARRLTVRIGNNLSYETKQLSVTAGEPIEVRLVNPDVVPHNWALLQPGTTEQVGQAANRLVGDPAGAAMQYVPESDNVIAYTDIVEPKQAFSIFFRAPDTPGSYPFICTFPGHWMVMQGTMIVQSDQSASDKLGSETR